MIRSFIAVNLTDVLKSKIADDISDLKTTLKNIKWINSQNLHITLKFLGNIPIENIPQIEEILKDITSKIQPFEIVLSGIGCFPNLKNPHVIWIGVSDNGRLNEISLEINSRLSEIGNVDHKFSPHLTIGRINNKIHSLQAEIERYNDISFGTNRINSITLMKSELHSKGAIYTEIKDFTLPHPAITMKPR
jgi:2'-5' RNA ligase